MLHRELRPPDPAPPPIPGFEGVRRLWDSSHHRWTVKILPGELFVTPHDESISTIVGSCLAICMRDPALRIGGMNQFMLPLQIGDDPESPPFDPGGAAARYGRGVMERLLDETVRQGASRGRLKARMFGGGRNIHSDTDIGAKTIAFARRWLRERDIPVVAEKLGDSHPRRILYFPNSGITRIERLPMRYAAATAKREMLYTRGLVRDV
jgi:chemotaxis protein CheD